MISIKHANLLVVIVAAWEVASEASREGATHRRPTLIPSCQKMLEKVTEAQQSALRDAAQVGSECHVMGHMHGRMGHTHGAHAWEDQCAM